MILRGEEGEEKGFGGLQETASTQMDFLHSRRRRPAEEEAAGVSRRGEGTNVAQKPKHGPGDSFKLSPGETAPRPAGTTMWMAEEKKERKPGER